jgi:SAM-dependent methyltransferase
MEPLDRDTNADWERLGRSQPYWGVLSHADFLRENITPERLEAFYASGKDHIRSVVMELERHVGRRPGGRALDFGCGVGRLAEAMADYADEVTGLDISPGMLELARGRGSGVQYVSELPAGAYDWINSFIVFQHIPPERGMQILEDLLAHLAPDGMVSVQLTAWRDPRHQWTPTGGRRASAEEKAHRKWLKELPVGQIFMYDYDLSQVVRLLNLAGIFDIRLLSTDHDGHHGAIILGCRSGS